MCIRRKFHLKISLVRRYNASPLQVGTFFVYWKQAAVATIFSAQKRKVTKRYTVGAAPLIPRCVFITAADKLRKNLKKKFDKLFDHGLG